MDVQFHVKMVMDQIYLMHVNSVIKDLSLMLIRIMSANIAKKCTIHPKTEYNVFHVLQGRIPGTQLSRALSALKISTYFRQWMDVQKAQTVGLVMGQTKTLCARNANQDMVLMVHNRVANAPTGHIVTRKECNARFVQLEQRTKMVRDAQHNALKDMNITHNQKV